MDRQKKIEDYINALAASTDPSSPRVQTRAAKMVGLSPEELTAAEIKYIEKEVARRW